MAALDLSRVFIKIVSLCCITPELFKTIDALVTSDI